MTDEEHFERIVKLPAASREEYLDEIRDQAQRKRIVNLLAAHEAEDSLFVDADLPSTAATAFDETSQSIGPYKLREQIGEGGMGTVYVAEQDKPVRRKVALKLIKAGMDTKHVIARFEAERQALALMDHPNIAKVLDAGSTDAGRPYFVMELVQGIPITEYCDQHRLTVRERLELFVKVCLAIQHAHHKGIIHRDVKPSNVLVTEHDGIPVPKVIDFGVAKAIGQKLTDKSVYTHHLQPVGTLQYMSPEQSRLSGLDVDTRSDVYALGLLLYELITGALPFDRKTFSDASFDEKRRIIAEEEAPRPSTRISSSVDTSASVSRSRQTEIIHLASELRGEVDWILIKALDKDRNRRYESASRFAADVENFLNGEIVDAKPPTSAYRLKKLWQKNKRVVSLTFAGIGAVLGVLVITIWLLDVKSKALEEASKQGYLSDMNAAVLAIEEGDVQRANELLRRNSPGENATTDYRGKEWWYLKELCERLERTEIVELENWANSAAISPDRKLLVLPLYLKRVAVIDLDKKELKFYIPGNLDVGPSFAAFSSDNQSFLCPSVDGCSIRRVAASNGEVLEVFKTPNEQTVVRSVVFSEDDRHVLGASAGQLHVWKVANSQPISSWPIFDNAVVNAIARSPDGTVFACGLSNGKLMVIRWTAVSGKVEIVHEIQAHHQSINAVCFSPDASVILTGSTDTTIKIFDASLGQETAQLFGHRDDVRSIDFSPNDPNVFASAGRSREWKLWDLESRTEIATLRGHSNGRVGVFSFHTDEYITEEGRELRFWKNVSGFRDTLTASDEVEDIALTKNGEIAVCLIGETAPSTVELRSTQNGSVLAKLAVESPTSIALSQNDDLFIGDSGGWITWYDLRAHEINRYKAQANSSITALDVTQVLGDSSLTLALGTENGSVEVVRVERGVRELMTGEWKSPTQGKQDAAIWAISISNEGLVVSGDQSGLARVWSKVGKKLPDFEKHSDSIRAVDFSPTQAELVVTAGYDGHVYLWNVKTLQVEQEFAGDSDWMRDVKFLSDGMTVVTASGDGSLKFLDVRTRAQRIRFLGHEAAALCCALTPDDNVLVSGGHDKIIRVYRVWNESPGSP